MEALIFAAGYGTRLKPLTDAKPKALIEVNGKSMLEHQILKLKKAGFDHLVINVHHFAQQIIDFLAYNDNFKIDIKISDERDKLRDTGGGIRYAANLLGNSPFLVHNVDVFTNLDIADFYSTNISSLQSDDNPNGALAILLVSDRRTSRYFLFDQDDKLVGWTNISTSEVKTPYPDLDINKCKKLAFDGIHLISPNIFGQLKPMDDVFSIVDFYLSAAKTQLIKGVQVDNLQIVDIGKVNTLEQIRTDHTFERLFCL